MNLVRVNVTSMALRSQRVPGAWSDYTLHSDVMVERNDT